MSRSRQKMPIFGITSARSERFDKDLWHRRFRREERLELLRSAITGFEVHLPVHEHDVSSPWLMDKDSKRYVSLAEEARYIDASSVPEHEKRRLFRKLMAK